MKQNKEIETSEKERKKFIRMVRPETRIKAMNFIKDLFCIACPYDSECSSRYPEHLIKCKYLEKWSLDKYTKHIEGKTDEYDEKMET